MDELQRRVAFRLAAGSPATAAPLAPSGGPVTLFAEGWSVYAEVSSGHGASAEQWLVVSAVLGSVSDGFVKRVQLIPAAGEDRVGHPSDLPAVAQLTHGLELHPKVTYLIGENGSGKSTLLAAIAMLPA